MPTNDELRQMCEAYAKDDIGSVDYISFLEAHAADQQQRIDAMERAIDDRDPVAMSVAQDDFKRRLAELREPGK